MLQQYVVEFPDGRLQALSLAWDTRPKEERGQRWFHLYPNEEIRHDDVLHWTKLNQNWIGALDMLEGVPPLQIWPLVSPLLTDASRGVRIKAADLLAAVPAASQPSADREKFERAATEFVAAQRLNADRPESRSRLGNFYARRGFAADAEAEYGATLKLILNTRQRRLTLPIFTGNSVGMAKAKASCLW